MNITEYYLAEKKRFMDNCITCGLCAKECPILPHTRAKETSFAEIQQGVFDFINSGKINEFAFIKAFACMECFKCTQDVCPEDLNPLLINELVKGAYIVKGLAERPYGDPGETASVHRVLASVLVSADEYRKITTVSDKTTAEIVFFPGCNVYFQPEKILSALDIMDAIGDDYAFLPGLDNCCGDKDLYLGDTRKGSETVDKLMTSLQQLSPKLIVLWCPTCLCRFDRNIAPAMDLPFDIISFPEYLAANIGKLDLKKKSARSVTLHEACKTAYTGLDRNGARTVLQHMEGVNLIEMASHGANSLCCGSGAYCWFGDAGDAMRTARLREAKQTGADYLVTVCHYCSQAFTAKKSGYDFTITNYVSLVADAMGTGREDTFQKYSKWADVERIMEDAREYIDKSPFNTNQIIAVLTKVFVPSGHQDNGAGKN